MAQTGLFERGCRGEEGSRPAVLHPGFTGHRLWKPIEETQTVNIANSNCGIVSLSKGSRKSLRLVTSNTGRIPMMDPNQSSEVHIRMHRNE